MTAVRERNAERVVRMAGALGLDPDELMMRGNLSEETLDDMALRCRGCTDPDGCEIWLYSLTQTVDHSPGMCRNADLLYALRARYNL